MFDSGIARWVVQDPVVHHFQSPYNGFDGNLVYWADPSGADGDNSTNRFDYDGLGRARYDEHGWYIDPTRRGQARPDVLEMLAAIDRVSGGGVGKVVSSNEMGSWVKYKVGVNVSYNKDNGDSILEEITLENVYTYEFIVYNSGWGNAPNSWDIINGATGTYLTALQDYAVYNSKYVYKYGSKAVSATSLTAANTARMLNIAKGAQVLGNTLGFVSGGISLYNAYDEYNSTGNVNYKSIVDGTVSLAGASAGTAMMFGLVSNPVGWAVLGGIAAGAAIYGVISFGVDLYKASK
jgi:hypothetical protein